MSRAYRVSVQESLRTIIRAEDHVSTRLELLEILPPEQMTQLLSDELEKQGFVKQDGLLTKEKDGLQIELDLASGELTVRIETEECIELQDQKAQTVLNEDQKSRAKAKEQLRQEVQKRLSETADQKERELQETLTDELEAQLGDVRRELDQAVHRVTAEALKRKAAQIGQIKEMAEDPEQGSLTIVVEV